MRDLYIKFFGLYEKISYPTNSIFLYIYIFLMKAKKQISALSLLSVVVLLTACTNNTAQKNEVTTTPVVAKSPITSGYKDGAYIGTGKYSFPGGSVDYSVSLTLSAGKISEASFVKFANSGNEFYTRAQGDVALKKIVGTSNRTIDAVTGATGTSVAIQDAIDNALSQAQN
ncbi:hypothetical protein CO024_01250 [Candidatus Gracilibacteria bacterium CG_4_9_14_0_2_um_filter_38_7]|nr:MAG: hypothetical protein AUJ87_02380 [Candidatus Gracilibacteria bacterium CG1_02_38_174]PIQ11323.1 MAG: hypothetical protein COW68_02980 [Candidatus Gracilibacteria bacterium CG18_big_fil_WC_8_21_14_2_50_38_16]PIZ02043.1 MAG: hypothetical protein COY60_00375 [Candidatus Gracilibacteria bacterium CG_4_10_14_0_8_um_filter_38_28]PJC56774.1 MAG: hypothetical protein CO024_01250 [Candidatus Gracilibacteria bacterium CG_4_9_14_0_2_um_filter_38_7]